MSAPARWILALLMLASLVAFWLPPAEPQLDRVLESPGWRHWMGTDSLGRDLFLRVLRGNFTSWAVGAAAAALALVTGSLVGFIAGWRGGFLDLALMRVTEVLDSIPAVVQVTLLVLLFRSLLEGHDSSALAGLAVGIGLTHWVEFARLTRVLVLQESKASFVEGALAIGASPMRILWVHLRPNLTPALMQSLWAQLPAFLIFESLVSFLGFGVQPPGTSLGILLQEGWKTFSIAPHLLLAPGLALFVTLLCFQAGARGGLPSGQNYR